MEESNDSQLPQATPEILRMEVRQTSPKEQAARIWVTIWPGSLDEERQLIKQEKIARVSDDDFAILIRAYELLGNGLEGRTSKLIHAAVKADALLSYLEDYHQGSLEDKWRMALLRELLRQVSIALGDLSYMWRTA